MLPVTFGIHKTFFLVASTLGARLGPKPVYRNAKCRGGAESSAQAKQSADVCRGAVKEPMRNARTAAGFEPTPSKMPLCEASESLKRQQASCPRHAKHKPEKRQAKNGAFATLPHGAETAGNGSEKAKRHYKPSSGKPKTMRSQPFHTVPKLQLRSRKKNIGKGP